MSDSNLIVAREFITRVLSGEITPQTDSFYFQDDIVLKNTVFLEVNDPDWLLAQMADTRYPLSGRICVLSEMRSLYAEAFAILQREDPDIGDPSRPLWK